MVPLLKTLIDRWSGFRGHNIVWSRLSQKTACLRDWVTGPIAH